MAANDQWEKLMAQYPPRSIRQRTCVYLTDKATGDNVEIVSENLEVKAERVKESND